MESHGGSRAELNLQVLILDTYFIFNVFYSEKKLGA